MALDDWQQEQCQQNSAMDPDKSTDRPFPLQLHILLLLILQKTSKK